MKTELVLPLSGVNSAMVHLVGGKAAHLGDLIEAGFPVPQGFCLTTEAYRRLADEAGVDGLLGELTRVNPGADSTVVEASAARLREIVVSTPVPADIRTAIVTGYAALGDRAVVAVRSSATAEDLPSASFAGQQDSFLGIVGADSVVDAVQRCWASLWSERAVTYRNTRGVDHRDVRLAVVVQLMIDSAVAGVLFTANAVTGRRRQAVIDASPGLGEAVVSGAVTPDHFVVDTGTGRVLQRRRGDKAIAIGINPAGGTQTVPSISPDRLCLDDPQLRCIAAMGDRVERHFGSPQDIEWAIDASGELWLTQSRPITTLFPLPGDAAARPGLRVYFCFSVAQGLYRPLTPAGLAAFRVLASGASEIVGAPVRGELLAGPPVYVEAAQRVFVDLTGVLRSRVGRGFMPRVLDLMETRSATILRDLFDRPEFSVTHRSVRPSLRRALRIGVRYRIPPHVVHALISPAAAHRRVERITGDLRARLVASPNATPEEMLDEIETILFREAVPLAPKIVPAAAAGLAMFGLAARLLRSDLEPGELQTVLRGLPHNPTTEMDLHLWAIAQRIRSDDAAAEAMRNTPVEELTARFRTAQLPPTLARGLGEFLATYGHRAVAEIDVGVPRWSEDPTHILGVLANYLRLQDPALGPDAVFARSDREARDMIDRLASKARRRGRLRAAVVSFALRRTRELAGIREMPKNDIVLVLAAAREQLASIGSVLTTRGLLDDRDDIFFLSLAEVRTALAGTSVADLILIRRAEYEREMRRRRVPRVILSDGTEPEAVPDVAAADGRLSGVPASPGSVTGPARVVLDPVGAHLEPGEILVAPSTDPGWTPLFLTAGGLVMEMGGPNSHGAVVAREYGIPAVVGVPLATDRLASGRIVVVNGTLGTVTPAAESTG